VASIARVKNPQAGLMEGCEPLTGYILRQIAKPLVEGGVGITAIDGRGIRRGCQETEPKRTEHRVFHVGWSFVASPGSTMSS